MIRTVYRTRNGTPVRTFKVDLPLVDGVPQDPEAYINAAMKMKGADFKFDHDKDNRKARYGWQYVRPESA